MTTDKRPTFQQVRREHDLDLTHLASLSQVSENDALLIDRWGMGTPQAIDAMLHTLSTLTGQDYTRLTLGGFTFCLTPDYTLLPQEKTAETSPDEEVQRMEMPTHAERRSP